MIGPAEPFLYHLAHARPYQPFKINLSPFFMRTLHSSEWFALGSLAVGVAIAVASLIYAAGYFEWNLIYLWVVSPYALCAATVMLPEGTARRRMAGCMTAVGMLIFSFLFYVEGLVRSTSSTSGLAVIFAPFYLFVGGAALWALVYKVAWRLISGREESQ